MLEKKKRQFKICSKCKVRNSAKASFCRDCGADLTKEKIQKRGKTTEATKELPVADPLTKYIIAYITFLKSLQSKPVFLFPPVVPIFGGEEIVCFDRHITGRTVFNIIKTVNPRAWAHLFRETAAADVIKQDDSLTAVFKVQRRLDLESYEVAFNYLRRFSVDKIERESLQKNG